MKKILIGAILLFSVSLLSSCNGETDEINEALDKLDISEGTYESYSDGVSVDFYIALSIDRVYFQLPKKLSEISKGEVFTDIKASILNFSTTYQNVDVTITDISPGIIKMNCLFDDGSKAEVVLDEKK